MRDVEVLVASPGLEARAAELAAELRAQRTLGDVIAWAHALRPARTVGEVVTQDEYTHDVLLRYDERTWLAYDAT